MKLKELFGKRLRALRKQSHLTQEQLAEQAGISVEFLSFIERGINSPSFETLEKLADALDLPIKTLFDFDEEA